MSSEACPDSEASDPWDFWPAGSPRFCTTQWTVILGAGGEGLEQAAALEKFCRAYWYPVYAFIRRQGAPVEDARDLAQEFFARLCEREWLAGIERRETRFSTLLLTMLKRFLATAHRDAGRQKRGGGVLPLSLDAAQAEEWFGAEPATDETPERIFARRWARAVLATAHEALRAQTEAAGKARHFELLGPFLAREPQPGEYESAGAELDLDARAVAVAVHRLRQQYREMLRGELGAGVIAAEAVEEELRDLAEALR